MAQRIIFPARSSVELQNFDPGDPTDGEILVRTQYSLISIGTETIILHQRYSAQSHFAKRFSFPQLKTGVMAVGEIRKCGTKVSGLKPGDRIFMRQAHGSHQCIEAIDASLVPEAVDASDALWCGLAKTAFRAAHAASFDSDTRVLIIGAGPVGQMTTRWANFYKCANITVSDLSKTRLHHAKAGGAHHTLCGDTMQNLVKIADLYDGNGPDVVVDTTGSPDVLQAGLQACAQFGRIILLGDTGYPEKQHLSPDMMTKGLTIQATHDSHDLDGWTQPRIDRLFFDALQSGRFQVDGLISATFKPQEFREAYRTAEDDRHQVLGLRFDWN